MLVTSSEVQVPAETAKKKRKKKKKIKEGPPSIERAAESRCHIEYYDTKEAEVLR